jgi:hypothetical protein
VRCCCLPAEKQRIPSALTSHIPRCRPKYPCHPIAAHAAFLDSGPCGTLEIGETLARWMGFLTLPLPCVPFFSSFSSLVRRPKAPTHFEAESPKTGSRMNRVMWAWAKTKGRRAGNRNDHGSKRPEFFHDVHSTCTDFDSKTLEVSSTRDRYLSLADSSSSSGSA